MPSVGESKQIRMLCQIVWRAIQCTNEVKIIRKSIGEFSKQITFNDLKSIKSIEFNDIKSWKYTDFFSLISIHRYNFKLKPFNPDHKPPTPKDLVYLEPSPGFCEKNPRLGILGTSGRQCNETSLGVDGCDLMCCGRGYRTQEVIVVERCACTFHWCCEVKCKTCRMKRTIHTCI